MNLAVTMTACRRPQHAADAVRSVREAGYIGKIVISIDAGECSREVEAKLHEVEGTDIQYNDPPIGLWANKNNAYHVYERALRDPSVDAILAIEDDCVLSPDAIDLCHWFLDNATDRYKFLSLASNIPNEGGRPLDLWEMTLIASPWAWCFTRESWVEIRQGWNCKTLAPTGWDWSLIYRMAVQHWKSLAPALPRARNTGGTGSSTGAEQWWREHLRDAAFSDRHYGTDFRICPPIVSDNDLKWGEPWMHDEAMRDFKVDKLNGD